MFKVTVVITKTVSKLKNRFVQSLALSSFRAKIQIYAIMEHTECMDKLADTNYTFVMYNVIYV